MLTYQEQRYPVVIEVKVTLDDGDIFNDFIKGLNIGHALYLAKLNWKGYKVELVGKAND